MFDSDGGVVSTTEGWAATTPKMSSAITEFLTRSDKGLEDMKAKEGVKEEGNKQ
jgi:hypothetical protein